MKMSENNESMNKYQQLFFESPAINIIFNADTGDIIEINQATVDYYGYSLDQFLRMNFFEINTADKALISECIWKIKLNGKQTFRFKHRLKNGDIRDVDVFAGAFNFEDNIFINSIIFDVTEKLQIERELEKSRERLALVLAGTKSGIWDYDLINKSVYLDKQWKAILGYEEQELSIGAEEWQSFLHPEDIERVNEKIRECEEGRADHYEVEQRMLHKDGSYRWVRATGKVIHNAKREPMRAVGAITDITKLKEVEERILENETKLRDFAQAIPDVSAIVDEDGRYVEVFGNSNPFSDENDPKGKTFHQLFPQDLADSMLEDIRQTILSGENRSMIRELNFGSVKRYFEGRSAPMNYQVNGKRTVAIVASDITERLEVNLKLKFAYELQRRSDFINDILSGNLLYNERIITEAKMFGIDFNYPLYCCLIGLEEINYLQNQKNLLLHFLCTQTNYFIWDNRDKIGVLCQVADNNDKVFEESSQVASEITKIIRDFNPNLSILIGISDIHSGSGSIEKSYQEAWDTLISAHCQTQNQRGIFHYRNIGLFQILGSIYGKENTSDFVRKMLGPLIEYDLEKGSNLLITLEEILQSINLKDAASKLFIHQKTLNYRKLRIEKILRVSLDSFDARLALGAAIRLHKMNSFNLNKLNTRN